MTPVDRAPKYGDLLEDNDSEVVMAICPKSEGVWWCLSFGWRRDGLVAPSVKDGWAIRALLARATDWTYLHVE